MNKYIKNTVIAILAIYFVSCSDILDKNPLDQISSETFWTNQAEVNMGLAAVYANLLNSPFNYNQGMWDPLAGEACGNLDNFTISQGFIESTTGGIISGIYSDCYKGISSCHFFLENVHKAPIPDDIKTKYKGEVLFLKSFVLFYAY